MNRKNIFVYKGLIIIAILLSSLYFPTQTCRGVTTVDKDDSLVKMHYDRGLSLEKTSIC